MGKSILRPGKRFFISLILISLSLGSVTSLLQPRLTFAETPEEKAQKQAAEAAKKAAERQREADKKAAEAAKRIAEMQKRAEENIDYKFDRFKQATFVAARNEKVRSQSEIIAMMGDLFLSPNANVSGEVTKTTNPSAVPETVELYFWARAEKRKTLLYTRARTLDFLVDGSPLGPYDVKYRASRDGDIWLETMTAVIPYKDFVKIVRARTSMEGRLGDMEFKFNDYQRILYTTFLAKISPAAPLN
jgi:uncharacterized FlaG/YvyC family protein